MRRLEILDGMRGYFLVFMLLNHLSFTGGYLLVRVNHAELGFVQDAQGFVFLSGLLVGMVYARRMDRKGFADGTTKMWKRAGELYLYAMGCIALILGAAALEPALQAYWQPWLGDLRAGDAAMVGAAASLAYQPTFMDILPQYIVYLLVAPPLVWLCLRGRWAAVAIGSAVLWLAVQLGLHMPVADGINSLIGAAGEGVRLRAAFNVLAWQVVFMSGLVLGVMTVTNQIDWQKVFTPERTALVWLAVALLVFFLVWRVGFSFGIWPQEVAQRFRGYEVRPEFSLIFLVNFLALGWAMAWLLIAGPRSSNARVRRMAEVVGNVFQLPFLRLIGRHSLQVYAFHVPIAYAVMALNSHYGPFNEVTKTAIAITGVAMLALPALARETDWRALLGTTPATARADK